MNCILPLRRFFITTLVNKGIFHNYYNSTEIESYTQKNSFRSSYGFQNLGSDGKPAKRSSGVF